MWSNKDRGGEGREVPEGVFKQPLPIRLWSQRRLQRPLWTADPPASMDRFVINPTQAGGEHWR